MTPRREIIGDATLYLGDCRELLPQIDPSGAAIVADPPYGIWFRHSGQRERRPKYRARRFGKVEIVGDKEGIDPSPMLAFREVVIWGANHLSDRLPRSSRWLVWDKRDGMASNSFSDCELAWCSNSGAARLIRHLWNGICRATEKEARAHPMQKPVEVMMWSIGFVAAETIVDPYMGSGTTGVAALRLGRKFIGIEIEQRWFDIACRRIEAEARQPRLDIDERPRVPPAQDPLL